MARSDGETWARQTSARGRRKGRLAPGVRAMNRTTLFVMFAFIGCVIAFAATLPGARSGTPGAALHHGEAPLYWMARAASATAFMPPPPR
jgi:hypothetical protein